MDLGGAASPQASHAAVCTPVTGPQRQLASPIWASHPAHPNLMAAAAITCAARCTPHIAALSAVQTRQVTGDGWSGLPQVTSAPPNRNPGTRMPAPIVFPEQGLHRREAVLSLGPVPAAVGQLMLTLKPLRLPSARSEQLSGTPGVTAPAGHRQRPRLRSDPGKRAHQANVMYMIGLVLNTLGSQCVRVFRDTGSLMRQRSAEPLSEAPLLAVGSYVAAANEARERSLLVAAARVRQQHETSLWRGARADKHNAVRKRRDACCRLNPSASVFWSGLAQRAGRAQSVERFDRRPPLGPRRTSHAAAVRAAGQRVPRAREPVAFQRLQKVDEMADNSHWLASIAVQEASLLASLDRLDGLLWRKRPRS